jgi:hypothetical protein
MTQSRDNDGRVFRRCLALWLRSSLPPLLFGLRTAAVVVIALAIAFALELVLIGEDADRDVRRIAEFLSRSRLPYALYALGSREAERVASVSGVAAIGLR